MSTEEPAVAEEALKAPEAAAAAAAEGPTEAQLEQISKVEAEVEELKVQLVAKQQLLATLKKDAGMQPVRGVTKLKAKGKQVGEAIAKTGSKVGHKLKEGSNRLADKTVTAWRSVTKPRSGSVTSDGEPAASGGGDAEAKPAKAGFNEKWKAASSSFSTKLKGLSAALTTPKKAAAPAVEAPAAAAADAEAPAAEADAPAAEADAPAAEADAPAAEADEASKTSA